VKVFLIILGVLVLLIVLLMSVSAEFTVIFDNGWSTKIRVLFYEKDIKLTELLNFVLFPDKAGKEAADKSKEKKAQKEQEASAKEESPSESEPAENATETPAAPEREDVAAEKSDASDNETSFEEESALTPAETDSNKTEEKKAQAPAKKNPIMKIMEDDGIVGLLSFASNLIQTLNTAVTTLIKGLHIYSLYVKMIIGGGDAADIGEKFGSVCGWYYPLKGFILTNMRVDNYDDYIQPDFIAPRSEYEFQFIGSISVGLLVKMLLKAGKTFLVNYFKNK